MGLSAQAWVAILLAVWLVTALLLGIFLGKLIRRADALDREHAERVLAENRLRQANERLEVARREPASALPYSGPRGAHHADTSVDGLPAVRADLADATGPLPLPQVPGAWSEEVHPGRRAADRGVPPPPLLPGQPGGRRRSDTRQTRALARRLRDGDDDDATTTD